MSAPSPPPTQPQSNVAAPAISTAVRPPPPAYDFTQEKAPKSATVIVGNVAEPNPSDSTKFDWEFYLQIDEAARAHVDSVKIYLHPTFSPCEYTFKPLGATPEFRLPKLTGWGVFEIKAEIEWKAPISCTTEVRHMLQSAHSDASSKKNVSLRGGPATAPTAPPMPPMPPMQTTRPIPTPSRAMYGRRRSKPAKAATAVPAKIPAINLDKPRDDKHTVIAMVVDRSGSMSSMGTEVEGGCNAYLDEQRVADEADKAATTVLLTTFDSVIERVVDAAPLSSMAPITHEQVTPRGMTALYDGIGDTLSRTAELVNSMEKMPSVAIFILTDGAENSSNTWNKSLISAEIKRLQSEPYNWDFYFAAANQDAMAAGTSMGMQSGKCMQWGFEGTKMKSAMRSANVAYQRKKRGESNGDYLTSERMECL